VLAAMPWEQQESVVQEAMETLKETHSSSHTAILRHDRAGPSNTTQTPSNQCQLQFQVERIEWKALARHIKHLEDELNRVKGMLATVIESSPNVKQNQPPPSQNLEQNQPPIQSQPPIQTPIVDLPSSPSKAVKRGKPAKKKAKAAMVDLVSSPSKRDKRGRPANNEGETVAAMADLVSSPSKGATSVRYTRGKTRAQKNVIKVPPESEPVRNEVSVLFNDKVLKKCKFTLCWVHALTFFCLKITKYLTLLNLLSVVAHIFNYCCSNSMFSAVGECSFSVPTNSS
jgi:hypothetical protein